MNAQSTSAHFERCPDPACFNLLASALQKSCREELGYEYSLSKRAVVCLVEWINGFWSKLNLPLLETTSINTVYQVLSQILIGEMKEGGESHANAVLERFYAVLDRKGVSRDYLKTIREKDEFFSNHMSLETSIELVLPLPCLHSLPPDCKLNYRVRVMVTAIIEYCFGVLFNFLDLEDTDFVINSKKLKEGFKNDPELEHLMNTIVDTKTISKHASSQQEFLKSKQELKTAIELHMNPFDSKFFTNSHIEDFMCGICAQVLRDPMQTKCGHSYCKVCIDMHLASSLHSSKTCPECRTSISDKLIYQDVKLERTIGKLTVAHEECKWSGEFGFKGQTLMDHLGQCNVSAVPCPFRQCGLQISKSNLAAHKAECTLRPIQCEFCDQWMHFHDVEGHYYQVCQQFPLTCPNICSLTTFPRHQLEQHLKECPSAIVNCPNLPGGCVMQLKRRELQNHLAVCTLGNFFCNHCNISISYATKSIHEKEDCQEISTTCPYCEKGNILRKNLSVHYQTDCEEFPQLCSVPNCTVEMRKREVVSHYRDFAHQHMMLFSQELQNLRDVVNQLKRKQESDHGCECSGQQSAARQRTEDVCF